MPSHEQIPAPTLPDGTRIYATGDIHGRFDLLLILTAAITQDLQDRPIENPIMVFLGDYVDRGPDSCKVIDYFLANQQKASKQVCLKGNHEATFLEVLDNPEDLAYWGTLGGFPTLRSYGIPAKDLLGTHSAAHMRKLLKTHVPETHLQFLRHLPLHFRCGDYLFVHAGIRPGKPVNKQTPEDAMWIRAPFLNHKGDFGVYVVHGHTPVEKIERHRNRLAVDTEAHASDRLTCAVLEGRTMNYIEATPTGAQAFELFPDNL